MIWGLDTNPLNEGGGHERTKRVEMLIHLLSSIPFHSNVGHSLILDLFAVLGWSRSLPLSLLSDGWQLFCYLGKRRTGIAVFLPFLWGIRRLNAIGAHDFWVGRRMWVLLVFGFGFDGRERF